MTYKSPDLSGGSASYQLDDETKIVNVSDGVAKITNAAGTIGNLQVADGTASSHAITKAQLDAVIGGAPAALDTLNEIAAAINDDESYAATITTQLAEVNQDVTDLLTAIGISENATNLGTFTGSTIGDNVSLLNLAQALETALELRAVIANTVLTGTTTVEYLRRNGGHLKLGSNTNDLMIFLNDAETLQITRASGSVVNYTSHGGTGTHKFTGNVALTGTMDGRNVSADGAKVDNLVTRYKNAVHTDAGAQTDFGDTIKSGANVYKGQVRVITALDDSAVLQIGKSGTADYFGEVSAANLSTAGVYEFAVGRRIGSDVQPTFKITQSPTQGDVDIFLIPTA